MSILQEQGVTPHPFHYSDNNNDVVASTSGWFGNLASVTSDFPASYRLPSELNQMPSDFLDYDPAAGEFEMSTFAGSGFPSYAEFETSFSDMVSPLEAVQAENQTAALNSGVSELETIAETTGEAFSIAESVADVIDPINIVGQIGSFASSFMNSLGANDRQSASVNQYVDAMTNGRGFAYSEVARQTLTSQTMGNNTQSAVVQGLTAFMGPLGSLIGNSLPNLMFQSAPNVTEAQSNYNDPSVVSSGESTISTYTT